MKKYIILAFVLMITVCSKAQSGQALIDAYVYQMQSMLPVKYSNEMSLVDVEFKDKSLVQTYEFEQLVYLQLPKQQKSLKKRFLKQYIGNEETFKLIMELIKMDENFVVVYKCRGAALSFSLTITPDEWLDAMEKY